MHQTIIHALKSELDAIERVLETYGALSVTLSDAADSPVLEPAPGETPLWPDVVINSLFDAEPDCAGLRAALAEAVGREPEVAVEVLPDQDWTRVWMDEFKPMRFGKGLWICPSWCAPVVPDAVNILLDPGLAFGTGTHPTTALCLKWLDGHAPAGLQVIDYGCGSGILAIAALKLGAAHVCAVDIDPQALLATRNNTLKNIIAETQISTYLAAEAPPVQADLLLANILSGPLVDLATELAAKVRKGGYIVLSGILAEQIEEVVSAYAQLFEIRNIEDEQGWALIEAVRKL